MSSYAHVADNSTWSWNRGVQWWLIKEAKQRNPNIPLMALSWGMPEWVGAGKTLSQGGADYHVNYLLGAKRVHNITFDWIGICASVCPSPLHTSHAARQELAIVGFCSPLSACCTASLRRERGPMEFRLHSHPSPLSRRGRPRTRANHCSRWWH